MYKILNMLILVIVLVVSALGDSPVNHAVFDFREDPISNENVYELTGGWNFYWNHHLDPNQKIQLVSDGFIQSQY